VTVLPNSDRTEAEGILENFTKDIQEQGIRQIQAGAVKSAASMVNLEFTIRAGIAQGPQGQTNAELESIVAIAKKDQKEIARLRCDAWGCAN
jgi:hypothetical protein